jgi:hypothetical protein
MNHSLNSMISIEMHRCLQGLQDCADTLVGSAMFGIKGISGGEMKRTMVATELVTSPKCLFLDEPTSGLDSEIALALVRALRDVAASGRTVALTIHQPNSDISELFDDFMLLAKGRVMYAGVLAHSLSWVCGSTMGPFFDMLDVLLRNVTSHICTILTRTGVCLGIHALVHYAGMLPLKSMAVVNLFIRIAAMRRIVYLEWRTSWLR